MLLEFRPGDELVTREAAEVLSYNLNRLLFRLFLFSSGAFVLEIGVQLRDC